MCVIGGTRADNSFVFVWASRGQYETLGTARSHLELYVSAKKHQMQVARGFGLLYDESEDAPISTAFDNRRPGPDPELDRAVDVMMLKPVEQSTRSLSPTRMRARARR